MNISLGIILAFATMFFWGFGDFFIQKTTRKIGDWESLFAIVFLGVLILIPFCIKGFIGLFDGAHGFDLIIIACCGVAFSIAAILSFQAMKMGKISVIEPLWSVEIIFASLLAFWILKEDLSFSQIILIGALIFCFILLSVREEESINLKRFFLEKGVIWAIVGMVTMGLADFLLGWGSRIVDPVLAIFSINIIMSLFTGIYLLTNRRMCKLMKDIGRYPTLILKMSLLDNFGYIAYALAMSMAPIGIATSITESSIIVAVLLGLFLSKEKLQLHQKVGLVGAVVSALVLGFFAK